MNKFEDTFDEDPGRFIRAIRFCVSKGMTLEKNLEEYMKKVGEHVFEKNNSSFFKTEYHKKILHLEAESLIKALLLMLKFKLFPLVHYRQIISESHIRRYIEVADNIENLPAANQEEPEAPNTKINRRRAAIYLLLFAYKRDSNNLMFIAPNVVLIDRKWKSVQPWMQDILNAINQELKLNMYFEFETKSKARSVTPSGAKTNQAIQDMFGLQKKTSENTQARGQSEVKSVVGRDRSLPPHSREDSADNIKSPICEQTTMGPGMAEEFCQMFRSLGVKCESVKATSFDAFDRELAELFRRHEQLDEFVGELLARLGSPSDKQFCSSYFKIHFNELSSIFEKYTVLQSIFREDSPYANRDWSSLGLAVFYSAGTEPLRKLLEGAWLADSNRMAEIKKLASFQSDHVQLKSPSSILEFASQYLRVAFDKESESGFIDHLTAFQAHIGI